MHPFSPQKQFLVQKKFLKILFLQRQKVTSNVFSVEDTKMLSGKFVCFLTKYNLLDGASASSLSCGDFNPGIGTLKVTLGR